MANKTLNLNPDSLHSDGYIIPLDDGKFLLKRDKIQYKPVVSKDRIHIVRQGDNLWDLSFLYYKNSKKWKLIADANNIFNPLELIIGTSLIIPDREVIQNI